MRDQPLQWLLESGTRSPLMHDQSQRFAGEHLMAEIMQMQPTHERCAHLYALFTCRCRLDEGLERPQVRALGRRQPRFDGLRAAAWATVSLRFHQFFLRVAQYLQGFKTAADVLMAQYAAVRVGMHATSVHVQRRRTSDVAQSQKKLPPATPGRPRCIAVNRHKHACALPAAHWGKRAKRKKDDNGRA